MAWAFLLLGCGTAPIAHFDDTDADGDAAAFDSSLFQLSDAAPDVDGGACDPPDMLVVLDRSDSMKQPPSGSDGGASKWTLAVAAIDNVTAAPIDTTLRFGLELLPDVNVVKTDAGACGGGVMSIAPALGTGSAIAATLGSTVFLGGTPIGGALAVAQTTLSTEKVGARTQYALLVTDGKETCDALPPLPIVQALASAGVKTYVVGFGGAVDAGLLNDLACAGMTAKDFATSCTKSSSGYAASVPQSTHVFVDATSGDDLKNALATITSGTCCGCQVN